MDHFEGNTFLIISAKGRSIMCSEFLVMHPSGPFFTLTDTEYSKALQKHPRLNVDFNVLYGKK